MCNKLKKSSILMLYLCVFSISAAKEYKCKSEYGDTLLGEIIADHLDDSDTDLCLCGILHFTSLFACQSEKTNKDEMGALLHGDVNLKCTRRCVGYGVGAEVGIKANSGLVKHGTATVDSSFLFLETDKIGQIKMGYTTTAAHYISISGDKYLIGYQTAGSGDFDAFYNRSAGSIMDAGFTFDDRQSAKIVWLSPIVSGFSAGLSFTPNSKYSNLFKSSRCTPTSRNVITGALSYESGIPDEFNYAVSICGWMGKGKSHYANIDVHNVRAYQIGAAIGYADFKMSIGYTDNGKSFLLKKYATLDSGTFDSSENYNINDQRVGIKNGADSGKIYSVGISYGVNKVEMSAGYLWSVAKFSDTEKVKANIVLLAIEYKFNRRFCLYVEYNNIRTDTCDRARICGKACDQDTIGKNKANIIMLGGRFSF
jgi:predicted porin